jgi:hypothetical protein
LSQFRFDTSFFIHHALLLRNSLGFGLGFDGFAALSCR